MCMHNAACEQEHTCDMCMCNACILYVRSPKSEHFNTINMCEMCDKL